MHDSFSGQGYSGDAVLMGDPLVAFQRILQARIKTFGREPDLKTQDRRRQFMIIPPLIIWTICEKRFRGYQKLSNDHQTNMPTGLATGTEAEHENTFTSA